MKLLWITLFHLLIAAVLGGGIYMLMHGKPALLIGSVAVYALMFARVCATSH